MKMPPRVKHYVDDNGHARFYTRIPGVKSIALPGLPWSTEFMDVLNRAIAGMIRPGAGEIGASKTKPGTVNAALVAYYRSTDFTDGLAASTQGWRRRCLEKFREKFGDLRIRNIERRHVQAYLSSLPKAGAQRNAGQALAHFFAYCEQAALVETNVGEDLKRAKLTSTPIYTWTEDDVVKFERRHPIGTKARMALQLYLNLCVRKSDVVRIGPGHVKDGELSDFQPQKTSRTGGHKITVPLLEDTLDIIRATPVVGTKTYLVTEFGKAFTANGFGNKMRQWCDEAGLPECTSHGLRKLGLIRLAYVVPDVLRLASISGHKNLKELQLYVEMANRKRLARETMAALEAAQKQARKANKTPT